ncbi:transaldolase [Solimonas terrae]|uniref:Transaldolase n=1 Tax=Solimonas terrae TaxID=1396819 RepID=A0A6M2BVX3_9GAMM|nr:transaldolase [Solimonas terrae]NGY06628.1 transaldolase [Solimonas terrae]
MKQPRQLHELGQSLWLDNITRSLLDDGGVRRYIDDFWITGLTSNPTIFNGAIGNGEAYDGGIREKARAGKSGETLFIELALEDLRRAADLFRPVFDATQGIDGWVSMEISPLLSADTEGSIAAARKIHAQADRPNLFVKIPGTPEGLPAIEALIVAGIPVNVTLLFSREQYLAAADAYMRGIERRIAAGLGPHVASVASLFVSRWDKAVSDELSAELRKEISTARARAIYAVDRDAGVDPKIAAIIAMSDSRGDAGGRVAVPADLRNRLGIAVAQRTYRAYRELLASSRWQKLAAAGARPQRLLWASTGCKDPQASASLYVEALAAPDTINTMPEKTLHAFAEHSALSGPMAEDGADAEAVLARFAQVGIDIDALALQLQEEGARSFVESWNELLQRIAQKSAALTGVGKAPA